MIGCISGINPGILAALYMALLIFGIGYNALTSWAERRGYTKGYLSLFVAFGVAVTLVATVVVSWQFALITTGAFIASGLPMILGSIWRHVRDREKELERLRAEAKRGNESETLAK
jgi:predicted tellurium resistance membrane protein TerC